MSNTTFGNFIEALSAKFPASAHKTRGQAGRQLTYLSIDSVINRLNDVLGPDWSDDFNTKLEALDNGTYLATCEGWITVRLDDRTVTRYGCGAMVNKDPDMAMKTALAEAIKKAGHAFGIGLYLWDETEREKVEQGMRLDRMTTAEMKRRVYNIGLEQTGKADLTAAALAKHFKVKTTDLNEKAVLAEIITENL